jgi:hypothetical protein
MTYITAECVCGIKITSESERQLLKAMERHWLGELHKKTRDGDFNK